MKSQRIERLTRVSLLLVLLATPYALRAQGANSGTIFGIVRDSQSNVLPQVKVTLTGEQAPIVTDQTTTNAAGEYRFAELPQGQYTLTAELSGYLTTATHALQLIPTSASVSANLTLVRYPTGRGSDSSAKPQLKLELQASGLHGLIDPGGYSASASADSASGLLRGIADVRRTDRRFGGPAAKDWPCALEPRLKRDVESNPGSAKTQQQLGEFYVAHDQPILAIPLLRQALKIDPEGLSASKDLAVALMQEGQFEDTRKLLAALLAHHDVAEVHILLAHADEGLGLFQQAAQEYRSADREAPSEDSQFGVGYELILSGSPSDAGPVFEAAIRRYPLSVSLRIGVGTAQFLQGHSADAVHSFLEATDLAPSDPRPYSFLADASSVAAEERDRVRSSFQRFLEQKPDSAVANYYYALSLSRENAGGNSNHIESLLKRAIELDPTLVKAHLLLGDLYAQRGAYEAAVSEYESVIGSAPKGASFLGEAHYHLALALKRAGKSEQSSQEMNIFQQNKAKQATASDSNGIDLEQFISVLDASSPHVNEEAPCVIAPR